MKSLLDEIPLRAWGGEFHFTSSRADGGVRYFTIHEVNYFTFGSAEYFIWKQIGLCYNKTEKGGERSMNFSHCDHSENHLTLHDCIAERAYFENGKLGFEFHDGFWVLPNHPESNLSEKIFTFSRISYRFKTIKRIWPMTGFKILSVFAFIANCLQAARC